MTWMRSMLLLSVLGVLFVLASVLAFTHTYRITSSCNADLLWNADDAYVFLGCGRLGYRLSYLEYPLEALREYFGVVRQVDDTRSSTIVLWVTPTAVQTHTAEDLKFDFYTPLEGTVFANHDGALWKWSSTRFEKATAEEQQTFEGTRRLSAFDFTGVGGWSKRSNILNQNADELQFPLELGGKSVALVVKRQRKGDDISINLVRSDIPVERIWYLDQRPHIVTKAEYELSFPKK